MRKETYSKIENYMLEMMTDAAHDCLHIYRVLNQALHFAENYNNIDTDVLVDSCLLHDIVRQAEFNDPVKCHAEEGAELAYSFMRKIGWDKKRCMHIHDCIKTHRFRTDNQPVTMEAKILFDSDKLDVTGALGIARSLMYKGQVGEPLYTIKQDNSIYEGYEADAPESFLKEYHIKLLKLYDYFYTEEAKNIARMRKRFIRNFYEELLDEINTDNLELQIKRIVKEI